MKIRIRRKQGGKRIKVKKTKRRKGEEKGKQGKEAPKSNGKTNMNKKPT